MASVQRVECRAESLDDQGAGVGHVQLGGRGVALHVSGLLPGEGGEVEVQHLSPHQPIGWARLRVRHNAAPNRVTPSCGAYGRCGGCTLQHLAYADQPSFKRERVRQALAAVGVSPAEPLAACQAAPQPLGYRSRVKLVVGSAPAGSPLRLGAFRPRSHELVDLRRCAVMTPGLRRLTEVLAVEAGRLGIRGYEEAGGESTRGELRYVLLREAADGGQQVSLVCAAVPDEGRLQALVAALMQHPELAVRSVTLHHNDSAGNVLLPFRDELGGDQTRADRVLAGEAALWDQIGGLRLRLSPRSFSQVQRPMAARIYEEAADALLAGAEDGARLVDLYCGVGGIGLTALLRAPAGLGLTLVGVEESPAAVADAEASAAALGKAGRFLCADATAGRLLLQELGPGARVVVNPPRRGCAPAVLEALATAQPPVLVYVSCDPDSLGRDLAWLVERGLRLVRVTPYDMHPHTPHVEAVAVLRAA